MRACDALKDLRKKSKLSQTAVAAKMGMSRPTYYKLESGKRAFRLSDNRKIAEIFEIPLADTFGWEYD